MGANQLGQFFQVTTWGESHGKEMGLVIDGCPPNISISEEQINHSLTLRAPGQTPWTSPRKETDCAEILSGVYEGKTTGHPIAIRIPNKDARSSAYQGMENVLRPGHANATYLEKYGIYDYRGGGRASARETACRVAAGAIAEQLLEGVEVHAYLKEIGSVSIQNVDYDHLKKSPIFCPDPSAEKEMIAMIERTIVEKDSVGGIVEVVANNLPVGLGDPVYQKLEANLAHAMLSIPASKGFEIGSGFQAARMKGSEHNDAFIGLNLTETNHAGGTLGGISNGMPVVCRVAFKPTSSIGKTQKTVDLQGNPTTYQLPEGSRHDPCVTIRAVPVVRAMMLIVLADRWVKRYKGF